LSDQKRNTCLCHQRGEDQTASVKRASSCCYCQFITDSGIVANALTISRSTA